MARDKISGTDNWRLAKSVEEEIRDLLEEPVQESNRVDAFKDKAARRFFATISAWVGKSFFTRIENGETIYDKAGHSRYNARATSQLLSELKRLGLEYQKAIGGWQGGSEYSFIVWNTAYTWDDFVAILLKLSEDYKQWAVCIGRKSEENNQYSPKGFSNDSPDREYDIYMYETQSLEDIDYTVVDKWKNINPKQALSRFYTVLTRKINQRTPAGVTPIPDEDKVNTNSVVFESLQENNSIAASESFGGAAHRAELLRSYFRR